MWELSLAHNSLNEHRRLDATVWRALADCRLGWWSSAVHRSHFRVSDDSPITNAEEI